jgi:O-antigen/teichoic acid export membrane protein
LRRFFARNLLFIVGINLLVKPVWIFLIDRGVQNRVGHAAYGEYQALLNMAVILQFVLDFGLNSYNTRMTSREPEHFAERFPQMLSVRLVLMLVYAVAVLGTGVAAGYRGESLTLLCGTLLIQTLTTLLLFIRGNIAAFQRFRLDGLLSVADRLMMIVVCGALLTLPAFAGHFQIAWFVWAQVVCYAAAISLGFWMLWKVTKTPLRLTFHFAHLRDMLRASFPYALLTFLMSLYMRLDMTLLERLAGKEEAGIYAAAYRQLDVGNVVAILFAGVLLPLFGRMLSEQKPISPILRLSTDLLLPVTGMISAMACCSGTDIMHMLYPASGAYEGRVFAWTMLCLPAYALMYIFSTLLTANGSLRLLNSLAAGATVLNLTLNLLLIPRLGAAGAAMVACCTQWSIALCSVYFAVRKNKLELPLKWMGTHLLYATVLVVVTFGLRFYSADWKVNCMLLALTAAILIPIFRFVRFSALRQYLLRR